MKFTESDKERALDLYQQGLTREEILLATGIGPEILYKFRKERGIPARPRIEDEAIEQARALYAQGLPTEEITKTTGLSRVSLFRKFGVRNNLPRKFTDAHKQQAFDLYYDGADLDAIQAATGIGPNYLSRLRSEAGLPVRPKLPLPEIAKTNRAARWLWLVKILLDSPGLHDSHLAKLFRVSERAIERDLRDLKLSGVPIVRVDTGFKIGGDFRLPLRRG